MEKWWGYLHVNGNIKAKRYFAKKDLEDAAGSDFVATYFGPFLAESREKAIEILEDHFR